MVTTHGGGGKEKTRTNTRSAKTAGIIEHYCCSLAGLLVTIAICLFLYPKLILTTHPFAMLATTTLVFLLFGMWAASWLVFEFIWEWVSSWNTLHD